MARDYELGIIVNPEVGDEQARAIVERITQFVGSGGGQVVRVNAWGRRHLAYPIEHHRDGLFFFFDLIMPPEMASELDRTLGVNEAVMRSLIKGRDPRVVAVQRQRDAEAEAHAAQAAQAAEAARAAQAAEAARTVASAPPLEDVAAEPEPVAVASSEANAAPAGDQAPSDEKTTEPEA
jgi:small subunit ribosomal protein S6